MSFDIFSITFRPAPISIQIQTINMNNLNLLLVSCVFISTTSCRDSMPDKPSEKPPAPREVIIVKAEPSVIYKGNFFALLDSICHTGAKEVSVTHRPYEVYISRDSLGHKSIQSYSSNLGKGKKRTLRLERVYLPSDVREHVGCISYFKKDDLF